LDELIARGLVRSLGPRGDVNLRTPGPLRRYALTASGTALVRQLTGIVTSWLEPLAPPPVCEWPNWDRRRRELRLGATLVKRFRRPAGNQELILSAFEEQVWPERIDDPLPRSLRVDPRHRLHETIKSLNHRVKAPLLHFGGDGTGQGVRWSLRSNSAQ
jgi:hypothetical protein